MIYGSVCSGIEAASVAWHPLGWRASFLSEIEAFPRAVIQRHYPDTPLHGDFTTIKAGQYDPIDVLVGGTPCQDFSIAGLRAGMAGDRGNLTLQFLVLARQLRPQWVVWENVPGVLSSNRGRDFGAFLGGLGELGYGFAYRVLDAQFFGVPQRRRRVFVVGYLGDWRAAAAVLFERHSLQGHPAPRREAGARIAQALTRSLGAGGPDDNRAQANHFIESALAFGPGGERDIGTCLTRHAGRYDLDTETFVATTLRARDGAKGVDSDCTDTLIPIAFHGSQDPDVSGDVTHPLGRNYGQEACIAFDTTQITSPHNHSNPRPGSACHSLATKGHPPAIAFSSKDHGSDAGEVAPTLRAMASRASHPNSGGQIAVCVTGDVAHTLKAEGFDASEDGTGRGQPMVNHGAAVRRLTPRECERLQGFPDDYTDIEWWEWSDPKAVHRAGRVAVRSTRRWKRAADGPRYKALGNSMAVPVMAWIGRRIATVDELLTGAAP